MPYRLITVLALDTKCSYTGLAKRNGCGVVVGLQMNQVMTYAGQAINARFGSAVGASINSQKPPDIPSLLVAIFPRTDLLFRDW